MNCLLTELKSSVQNENLDKLGILKVKCINDSFRLVIIPTEECVLSLIGATFSDSGLNKRTISANSRYDSRDYPIQSQSDTFYIEIPKYKEYTGITILECELNLQALKYTTIGAGLFFSGKLSGDLIEAINSNTFSSGTIELSIVNSTLSDKITGNVEELFDTGYTFSYFNLDKNSGLNGSLDKLGASLNSSVNSITLPCTKNVSLIIEDFVSYARTVQPERGTALNIFNTNLCTVKFNNTETAVSSGTLSWTATTITYNGVTIEG